MSEFTTVSAFIAHLKESGAETVATAYVVENLESIMARPARTTRRGQLHGLTLDEMSDEQLKREKINASSVLYKAKQRNAPENVIAANQTRVDAVNAALEARGLTKKAAAEAPADATTEQSGETNENVAAEV